MDHNKVPEGWKKLHLNELFEVKNGKTDVVDAVEGGVFPLFDRSDSIKRSNKYLFDCEAIILPGEGKDFAPKYYTGKFDLHQRAYALYTSSNNVNVKFFYYSINYSKKTLWLHAVGSTVKSLRLPIIQELELLVPPKPEQDKIEEILTTVDDNIEETDKIIAECERVKKGLMHALLIKGIPGRHKKFKETELGMVPEEWDILSLGVAAQFVNGRAFKPSDWTTDGIPIVRIQNLNGGEDYNYYVGEYEKKNIVRKGDLLFSWSGSRGTSFGPFIVQIEKGILNQHIFRVVPSSKIEMSFLYYFLKYLTYKIEGRAHGGAGLVHIKKSEIEKFKMVVPTISEQREIAETLFTFERRLEGEKARATQLAILKQALMQKLLSGEIRVKVN